MTRVSLSLLGRVLKVVASYLGVVGHKVYYKLIFILAGNITKSQVKKMLTVPACLYIFPLLVVVDNGESFLP